jgi:NADPH-dependent curcumin reductase CurA
MGGNLQVRLVRYPRGIPRRDDFDIVEAARPEPGPGEVLLRTLYLSLDPYVRTWMLAPDSHVPHNASLDLGDVVIGRGVSEVLESRRGDLAVGDVVVGETGWQAYSISDGSDLRPVREASTPSTALGVLGMPGFTGWAGLRFVGRPEPGNTVVVSAASGAVGSLVGQLARLQGCRAVGIAGAPEKCRFVEEELGFAACASHRSSTLGADLSRACPDGIDVYFDNVGGDVLAAVLPLLNPRARVVVCGRISLLNEQELPQGVDRSGVLLGSILTRRLTVQGFVWPDFADHFDEFLDEVTPLVAARQVRFREDVVEGLEQVPTAFGRLFEGSNFGKLVVHLADPEAGSLR